MTKKIERNFDLDIKTDFNILNEVNKIDDIDLKQLIKTINKRIVITHNRAHSIGHSYFASLLYKTEIEAKEELANIFKKRVIPLLQNYFENDFNKIREILADDKKEEKYQFIKRNNSLNETAFLYEDSYKKIYE